MKNLPEELLINILLCLPVKSLLRFKSVSKLWRSLISHPNFADSHFQRSSLLPERLLHIGDSQVQSIDFNSSFYDDSAVFQLPFRITSPHRDRWIWGSCRGFVLLGHYEDNDNLVVCNPSTGSYKRLPCFPMLSPYLVYGFGYDASNDDYLVVLTPYYGQTDANKPFVLRVFSMKANSWKKIDLGTNFPYLHVLYEDEDKIGLFLNGAIHRLAYSQDTFDTLVKVIIAFNVTERNFMEIPVPDGVDQYPYLGTLGGYLSLGERRDDTSDIWLMKEYGMKSSWTKSIVVSLANIPTNYFSSIGLTQSGEIVGTDGESGLVKCNDKGEVLEYRHSYIERPIYSVTYTETLLSLPCDSE